MANQGIDGTRLTGWKQIADFLGVSPRTARDYETEIGLPVHRLDGLDKSRVWAYAPELLAWKEKQAVIKQHLITDTYQPPLGGDVTARGPEELPSTVGRPLW